jgi:hypothetical protein
MTLNLNLPLRELHRALHSARFVVARPGGWLMPDAVLHGM